MNENLKGKISYLWFHKKDGWQVTSFDPRHDKAIGVPEDLKLFVRKEYAEELERKLLIQQELYYKLDSINCELNRKLGVAVSLASHKFDCTIMKNGKHECSCGYNELKSREALAQIEGEKK